LCRAKKIGIIFLQNNLLLLLLLLLLPQKHGVGCDAFGTLTKTENRRETERLWNK